MHYQEYFTNKLQQFFQKENNEISREIKEGDKAKRFIYNAKSINQ